MSPTSLPFRVIAHAGGSYPVHVDVGLLAGLDDLIDTCLGKNYFTITDDRVARELRLWRENAEHPWREPGSNAAAGCTNPLVFPHGEASKSREEWRRLTDELLDRGADRSAGLIAVGGGVVGDLAGFVAATYMRGIPVLHVPTTVVAMVDSAVGGKTGVDTAKGKNLVGAFHPPVAIAADPRTLLTLADREFRSGLAEAVKHAIMADEGYFDWLSHHAVELVGRDPALMAELVRRSVSIKARVVEEDERESGRRAHLNLGHTIGHGLEHASGYRLLHGEAVALGLLAECALASDLGLATPGLRDRIAELLTRLGLPTDLRYRVSSEAVLHAMGFDKKATDDTLRFALPEDVGHMAGGNPWTHAVQDTDRIKRALSQIIQG